MLSTSMGPQFDSVGGATHHQLPPMSAPPVRSRNMSGGSASSGDSVFPFHLISQLGDFTNSAVLNSALLALGQQQQQQQQHARLDRSISEPNAQNQQQKLHTSQGKNVVNPSRYKTEVCRPFNENGFCKYGDKCQFAHGDQEIRGLPRHPKYKTELCRTFHTIGFCPYGPRCHFIHSEDEYKLVEISHMKQSQQNQVAQNAAKEMAQQAAHLQAQQEAIQAQLKALVSQFHHSQLPTTQFMSQNLRQPSNDRPKLYQSISVQPLLRDNLGSAGDTPPESISSSPPVLSPVFKDDVSDILSPDSFSNMSGFITPGSDSNSSFNYSNGELSPLQMSSPIKSQPAQRPMQPDPASVASLAATLRSMSLNNQETTNQSVFSPPSSPDYNSDNSDGHYRLPVFSGFAAQ